MKPFMFILLVCLLFISSVDSKTKNCEKFNNQSQSCEKCYFGYQNDVQNKKCTSELWLKLIGSTLSFRYLMPIFQVKSIFVDFIGQYWFFSVNSTQEIESKHLATIIRTLNEESLWPFKIKQKIQNLIGKDSYNKFIKFMGVDNQISLLKSQSIKQQLFQIDEDSFQFTTSCLIRLFLGSLYSIALYLSIKLIDKLLSCLTNFRIFSTNKIKGIVFILISSQFYQFVSFYGFNQLKYFKGLINFGQKLNIILTLTVIFLFMFLSIAFLPLFYNFNKNQSQNSSDNSEQMQDEILQSNQLHKILVFSQSSDGFFFYLLDGPFKQFVIGFLVGYFEDLSILYAIIAIFYVIQLHLLGTIYKDFEEKSYFIFRKAFVVTSIIYLLFLQEQTAHIFSSPTQKFQAIRQICVCFLFVLSMLDTSSGLLIAVVKVYNFFSTVKIKLNSLQNVSLASKRVVQMRISNQEMSIAQKLLKNLKQAKDSQIIASLPYKNRNLHFSGN